MSPPTERLFSSPLTGGKTAIVLFILTLIAFVLESQLTQVRVSSYSTVSSSSFSLHKKKSMYKARFIIASRSSYCTSLRDILLSVENPPHMLVLPQLYCSLVLGHHLSTASIISRPRNVSIVGISPSRSISRHQNPFRPGR
jgi:hypothetical protein